MDHRPLPAPNQVATVLKGLLAKAVTVNPGKPVPIGPKDRGAVGIFVGDDKAVGAVILCDMAAAATLGAALALIPPAVAVDCVKRGKLDDNLVDNFGEVLNILGGLVNHAKLPRLALAPVAFFPPLAKEAAELAAKPTAKADFAVTVAGYAPSAISFLFAKLVQ